MIKNNILSCYEDEGALFLKSQDNEEIIKGRKAESIGTRKTYGEKEYIKTNSGWKAVGKNSGVAKQAHDFLHGDKKDDSNNKDTVIGKTTSGKNIHENFEHENHKDFTVEDHNDAAMVHFSYKYEKYNNSNAQNEFKHHSKQSIKHEDAAYKLKYNQ